MKATAIAPANIAFIKYWGKQDEKLRLPLNSSISLNLSEIYTVTTVEFSPKYKKDVVEISGDTFSEAEKGRMVTHLDRLRQKVGRSWGTRVVTRNNFPKSAGIAASASGFAALTVAGCQALGLDLSPKELTILARLGSGSACRSIPDGLVEWVAGQRSEDSYAYSLYPPDYWDLRDILLVVSGNKKKVASSAGMAQAPTSPLLPARLAAIPQRLARVKQAFKEKNLVALGEVIEEDCLDMHAVMQSQKPSLMYWTPETRLIMEVVKKWRRGGLLVYFTIDAGPNIHLICEGKDELKVMVILKEQFSQVPAIVNRPASGTHLIDQHLF